MQCALWKIPEPVLQHPWFIATLFDAYFGFLTFYCWLLYKERSILARVIWFVLIMLLGNMAMATYMLLQLFKVQRDAPITAVLLRSEAA